MSELAEKLELRCHSTIYADDEMMGTFFDIGVEEEKDNPLAVEIVHRYNAYADQQAESERLKKKLRILTYSQQTALKTLGRICDRCPQNHECDPVGCATLMALASIGESIDIYGDTIITDQQDVIKQLVEAPYKSPVLSDDIALDAEDAAFAQDQDLLKKIADLATENKQLKMGLEIENGYYHKHCIEIGTLKQRLTEKDKQIADQQAVTKQLVEACKAARESNPEPCQYDLHGDCQTHNLQPAEECWAKLVDDAIAAAEKIL